MIFGSEYIKQSKLIFYMKNSILIFIFTLGLCSVVCAQNMGIVHDITVSNRNFIIKFSHGSYDRVDDMTALACGYNKEELLYLERNIKYLRLKTHIMILTASLDSALRYKKTDRSEKKKIKHLIGRLESMQRFSSVYNII